MRESGIITQINGENATVKVDKRDECSKCGMCLFPKGASSIEFNAKNPLNAKVGDTVIIENQKDAKLFGAVLVFLVPLLLIALSAVITYVFIKNEIWMLILSVIFIVLWYTILAVIDKKLKNSLKYCSVIVEIKEKN
ncbi:MAG: hypothetical protein E7347_04100 [Clostridiales bacterium]|nr:hypothetical protein [Clostridiales bacterium]